MSLNVNRGEVLLFFLEVFCFIGVSFWCNWAVTLNKHIALCSASDNLITLITMLLWIAVQKHWAPFIHVMLCLRSLHWGLVHWCSLPFSLPHASIPGECKSLCVSVYWFKSVCLSAGDLLQPRSTTAHWIMHHLLSGKICWIWLSWTWMCGWCYKKAWRLLST